MTDHWKNRTVIFGGTFDPPHLGHRQAVAGLLQNPGVREVWVLPDGDQSSQKLPQAATEHRWQMVKKNFAEMERVQVLNTAMELKLPYSYPLILELRRQRQDLAFCLGADQWLNLPTWHRFPEILGICHWLILARRNSDDQRARRQIEQWRVESILPEGQAIVVETPAMDVSSSQIRQHLALGKAVENLLNPEVFEYLKAHRLYGSRGKS